MGYKILLPDEISEEAQKIMIEKGYELVKGSGKNEEDLIKDIPGMDGLIVRLTKVGRKVFEAADKLKVVARHGVGFDTVDLAAAREKGVQVVYAPKSNCMSVAEIAIFYMLYCSRNFTKVQKTFVDDFYYAKLALPHVEIDQKTVGLVGIGNIGSLVAEKALYGFHMKVIAYDPYKKKEDIPQGVKMVNSMEELLRESDFVSLHCPATTETVGMMNKKYFAMMKPSAYFINTARGTIVNEEDLYEALTNGIIAGAALDVMQKEPIIEEHKLLHLDNIVIGPHLGGATFEGVNRASLHSCQGVDEALSGQEPTWPVNAVNYSQMEKTVF